MFFLGWGVFLGFLCPNRGVKRGLRGLRMAEKRDFRNFFGPKRAIGPFFLDIGAFCGYSKIVFANQGGVVRRISRRAVAHEKLVVFRPQAGCYSRLG